MHIPDFELFLHPALDGIARHGAAQYPLRRGQATPVAFGQRFNVFQKLHPVRQQGGIGAGGFVQRPFEARVSNVQGKKAHGRG